jgi:hypothetical protein
VANAAPVALGAASQVNFEAHTAVELIADLAGFARVRAAAASPEHVFELLNSAMREFERVAHAEGDVLEVAVERHVARAGLVVHG